LVWSKPCSFVWIFASITSREDPAFIHLSDEKVRKYLGSLSATNLWTTLFDYDELTINMRQQGDESYCELLSRIRVGLLTKSYNVSTFSTRSDRLAGVRVRERMKHQFTKLNTLFNK